MQVTSHILNQAIELYLAEAYPGGVPPSVLELVEPFKSPDDTAPVPLERLEQQPNGSYSGDEVGITYIIRLGQPMYPHMKLALDPIPHGHQCSGCNYLLRVDAHDQHLHAAPGSPDDAWLQKIRLNNKELGERIEAKWAAAGLPTFKAFLRKQLEERRRARG